MMERTTRWVDPARMATDDYTEQTPFCEPDGEHPANVITSELPNGKHAITLDIDLPCAVVPSSTPGHYHLLIDKELESGAYDYLLGVLCELGIIGRGYYEHSRVRGFTTVRMPWVNKTPIIVAEPALDAEPQADPF